MINWESIFGQVDLMRVKSIFIVHDYLGFGDSLRAPCDCGDPKCENRFGGIEWTHSKGTEAGVVIRGINMVGDSERERHDFVLQMAQDVRAVAGRHCDSYITYHFSYTAAGVGDMSDCIIALQQTVPPVPSKWIHYIEWLQLDDKFEQAKEYMAKESGRVN